MTGDREGRPSAGSPRQHLALLAAAAVAVAFVAGCGAGSPRPTSHAAAPVQVNVPPYYVAVVSPGQRHGSPPPDSAVVRATTTGALVARLSPPRPYTLIAVTGAADDRTFVLYGVGPTSESTALYGTYRQRLFLLHVDPAASRSSARVHLTALPAAYIPGGQGRQLLAMALSPDGKSLAAIIVRRLAAAPYATGYLAVFDLASGTQRTWTRNVWDHTPEPLGDGFPLLQYPSRVQLSWTWDSRSLLFITGPTGSQVRLLDVDTAGSSLMADSHALPVRPRVILWRDAVITPNGKTVFIQYSSGAATVVSNLLHFSATTGTATIVNQVVSFTAGHPTGAGPDDVLWTNNNGSKFIVLGAQPGPDKGSLEGNTFFAALPGQNAGIYDNGHYTPLPWPASVIDAAW
jgi:hypothetical protein